VLTVNFLSRFCSAGDGLYVPAHAVLATSGSNFLRAARSKERKFILAVTGGT
jgi:hypothetical protein